MNLLPTLPTFFASCPVCDEDQEHIDREGFCMKCRHCGEVLETYIDDSDVETENGPVAMGRMAVRIHEG